MSSEPKGLCAHWHAKGKPHCELKGDLMGWPILLWHCHSKGESEGNLMGKLSMHMLAVPERDQWAQRWPFEGCEKYWL